MFLSCLSFVCPARLITGEQAFTRSRYGTLWPLRQLPIRSVQGRLDVSKLLHSDCGHLPRDVAHVRRELFICIR